MKFGTIVNVAGRGEGTVVYNGLDGVGIVWGRFSTEAGGALAGLWEKMRRSGGYHDDCPAPEAMLRDPHPNPTAECVGDDYEIVEVPNE